MPVVSSEQALCRTSKSPSTSEEDNLTKTEPIPLGSGFFRLRIPKYELKQHETIQLYLEACDVSIVYTELEVAIVQVLIRNSDKSATTKVYGRTTVPFEKAIASEGFSYKVPGTIPGRLLILPSSSHHDVTAEEFIVENELQVTISAFWKPWYTVQFTMPIFLKAAHDMLHKHGPVLAVVKRVQQCRYCQGSLTGKICNHCGLAAVDHGQLPEFFDEGPS